MANVAVSVDRVWKKFRRGEFHDSLRDLIPALARRLAGRTPPPNQLARRDFWALRDVTFDLHRGEALGIIGPNGAGKSTLLKILSRILRPNTGSYQVNGRLHALIEVGAGFHLDLTGRENIFLNGAILGMKQAEIRSRFDAIVDFANLEEFLDTPTKRYSSGMLARLGFAVAAHMQPDILLVDEVLSVGDAAFRVKCLDHMEQLMHGGNVSVIFISHNLEQVRRLCRRAIVLDHGTIRFDGDVEQACTAYYDCFRRDAAPSDAVNSSMPGRILGLNIRDEQGTATFRVTAHRPMTLEIHYQVQQSQEGLGVIVMMSRPGCLPLGGCSTLLTDFAIPGEPGDHTVHLHIDGLPLAAGDYLISARLGDRHGNNVSLASQPQPLTVHGPTNHHWDVAFQYHWSIPEGPQG